MHVFLECKIAEGGYTAGQAIHYIAQQVTSTANDQRGVGLDADATTIFGRYANNSTRVFQLLNRTTGVRFVLTAANWRVIIKAYA